MCVESDLGSEYRKLDFFDLNNEKRYIQYASYNQNMPADEIVWRVNNNLDKEKYKFDVLISDCADPYVIVNKYFKLPMNYEPDDLVSVDGCLMRKDTAKAYTLMRDTAKDQGFSILVTSAYRSANEQQRIYNKYLLKSPASVVDETVARPCYSEHQTGLAVDIQGSIPGGRNISKTPEAAWLKENCHKFGFILRYLPDIVEITGYASEPWHFRYVGVQISTDMKNKKIKSFEEYKERFLKLRNI